MDKDWLLKVWGPRNGDVAKSADFALYVTGVAMPGTPAAMQSF